jgi:hypothetical protein
MSDPTGGYGRTGGPKKSRGSGSQIPSTPAMSEDDSLAVEAYGARGAALKKTLATASTGTQAPDSTGPQRMVGSLQGAATAVRDFLSGKNKAKSTQEGRK